MPCAVMVATQLTDRTARSKTLTIGPYNVPLSTIGVPIESVTVFESGPGGVSSMSFDLIDLSVAYVLLEGMLVDFVDVDRQGPIFKGFIQSWSYDPLPVGRVIHVRCTGIDATLDWAMIPSLTIPIGTITTAAIQACWNAAAGIGVLLNVTADDSGPNNGYTSHPLEYMSTFSLRYAVVISNQTFRDAVQSVFDATDWNGTNVRAVIWGDMWGGVRANYEEQDIASYHTQDDFRSLAIYDQSAGVVGGTFTPNEFDFAVDAGAVPHQVYVEGSNAAGSGIVTDGSGLPGPIASLTDDTSDTAEKRNAIGLGYLNELGATVRGSVRLENHDPVIGPPDSGTMERAGATVTIDVPRVGQSGSSAEYRIYGITKTFLPNGNEDWVITFGGQAKSALRTTRKLTRAVRS